ncbi:zf-HC2 domain-containing protein [Paenibacillus illinoisensis]|uniref:Zf-HC2 domain-containing protein n=1 Tax=Paenibacillus illinoisensis TaxID=59845 RepID=A0ABW8HYM6_9BACL
MSKLPCDIVRDLLPLYYDDVCSTATKEDIEAHIATCSGCKLMLEKLKMQEYLSLEIIEKNKIEGNGLKSIAAFWDRSKARAFAKGVLVAASIFSLLLLGYIGLTQWNIVTVPTEVIRITDISQLSDGKIAYHVKMTDGYNVNQIDYKVNSEGDVYMVPVRPLIKSKQNYQIGLANMYDFVNLEQIRANQGVEIRAVYYGSPKKPILIWKKGAELPVANDTVKALFQFD